MAETLSRISGCASAERACILGQDGARAPAVLWHRPVQHPRACGSFFREHLENPLPISRTPHSISIHRTPCQACKAQTSF